MANPAAVSFWLDNKRVNGTSIAEDGAVKLVKYGSKLYVVEGKDPGRRSYSQSTLPTKWKKIIRGEIATSGTAELTPTGAPATALRIPSSVKPAPEPHTVSTAVEAALPSPTGPIDKKLLRPQRVKMEKTGKTPLGAGWPAPSSQQPAPAVEESAKDKLRTRRTKKTTDESDKTPPIARKLTGTPGNLAQSPQLPTSAEGEVKTQGKPRKPHTKANKDGAQLELETGRLPAQAQTADIAKAQIPAKTQRGFRGEKGKTSPRVPTVDEEQTPKKLVKTKIGTKISKPGNVTRDKFGALNCLCPYCQHKRKVSIAGTEIDKPVVVECTGCGKEFVLRIVIAAYQVQVAGFI